jgi:hypothetical protein
MRVFPPAGGRGERRPLEGIPWAAVGVFAFMRILLRSSLFPPYDTGGYEQGCHEVASAFDRRGRELAVLTGRPCVTTGCAPASDMRDSAALELMWSPYLESALDDYHPADVFLRRNRLKCVNRERLHQMIDRSHPGIVLLWNS